MTPNEFDYFDEYPNEDPFKETQTIFVFGSNLGGIHGKGSALEAKKNWGAQLGVGVGRTGNSYAIPTKDHNFHVLPLDTIKAHVGEFLHYAKQNPNLKFNVVNIGCGLAGYTPKEIAPFFLGHPENVNLSSSFKENL